MGPKPASRKHAPPTLQILCQSPGVRFANVLSRPAPPFPPARSGIRTPGGTELPEGRGHLTSALLKEQGRGTCLTWSTARRVAPGHRVGCRRHDETQRRRDFDLRHDLRPSGRAGARDGTDLLGRRAPLP